jgi:hypothetical protein
MRKGTQQNCENQSKVHGVMKKIETACEQADMPKHVANKLEGIREVLWSRPCVGGDVAINSRPPSLM